MLKLALHWCCPKPCVSARSKLRNHHRTRQEKLCCQRSPDSSLTRMLLDMLYRNRAHAQAVQLAMERRGRERELTSVLLAGLVPAPLTRDQLALGFTRLLASVEVRSTRLTAASKPSLKQRIYMPGHTP